MGGAQSDQSKTCLDLSELAGFAKQDDHVKKYFQHTSDSYLVITKCVSDLAMRLDNKISKYMTEKERKQFTSLQVRKEQIVDEVDRFVVIENSRYEDMQRILERGGNVDMKQLFVNSGAASQIEQCTSLCTKLTQLKHDLKSFKEELEHAMKLDGRNNQKWYRYALKWTAGIGGVLTCIAALTMVILHFVPGVNVTLFSIEIAGLVVAGGVAAGVGVALALSEDEIDRAIRYCDNLGSNLTEMKEALIKIEQLNTRLSKDQVDGFKQIIGKMVTHTSRISALCAEARK